MLPRLGFKFRHWGRLGGRPVLEKIVLLCLMMTIICALAEMRPAPQRR